MGKLLFTERFAFSETDSVLVIGLGRFGLSVALSLLALDHEVMGIDIDESRVQDYAHKLTHAVQADATNIQVLRQLGAADFSHAIVGIGSNLSASLMTVMALTELGIKDIWVKATNEEHGRIAERIGAHHVVYPEAAMGERVAHLVSGKLIDYIEFEDGFSIAKIQTPNFMFNQTLEQSRVRELHQVTVVGIKRLNQDFSYAKPDSLVLEGDLLIVAGTTKSIERFSGLLKLARKPKRRQQGKL